jgi:hypothetical protein
MLPLLISNGRRSENSSVSRNTNSIITASEIEIPPEDDPTALKVLPGYTGPVGNNPERGSGRDDRALRVPNPFIIRRVTFNSGRGKATPLGLSTVWQTVSGPRDHTQNTPVAENKRHVSPFVEPSNSVPDTQLELTNDEFALLRQHQLLLARTSSRYSSKSSKLGQLSRSSTA